MVYGKFSDSDCRWQNICKIAVWLWMVKYGKVYDYNCEWQNAVQSECDYEWQNIVKSECDCEWYDTVQPMTMIVNGKTL